MAWSAVIERAGLLWQDFLVFRWIVKTFPSYRVTLSLWELQIAFLMVFIHGSVCSAKFRNVLSEEAAILYEEPLN